MNPLDLSDKKIFVTGGSRGIGNAIVKYLADLGAQVAFTYTSREDAAQKTLENLKGQGHKMFRMDLNSEESIEGTVKDVLQHFGGIDGVVNNAGITKDQLLLRMSAQDFDQVLQTNLRGNFLVTKAFVKPMMKARKGAFVHMTSVIGRTGNAGQANYAASKAGLESFSRSVALELASRNIRSNCVAPGFIATEMTDVLSEETKSKIITKIPLQCIGEGSDVASCVAFLLSDASKYITGECINVNGGLFMN